MTSTVEFPLAELTTTLVRDVFASITSTAVEQADSYVALAAEVGMPVEVYQEKVLGLSEADKENTVEQYIRGVILPLLALPTAQIPDPLYFAEERKAPFLEHFLRVMVIDGAQQKLAADLVTPSQNASFPWRITRAALKALVTAKILRDAALDHARATTLLRAGLPSVVVTGGQICTKVTMTISEVETSSMQNTLSAAVKSAKPVKNAAPAALAPSLGVRVRVANERSISTSKSMEIIGSVRIDFRAGTFPPLDPGASSR